MKKHFLLLFSILTISLFGQIDNYGIKAGLNFASIKVDNVYNSANTSMKTSVYFGGYMEKKISEKESFVGEALISFQGGKLNSTYNGGYGGYPGIPQPTSAATINITQLNLPVYYKYMTNEKFAIHGGAFLGFILGSNIQGIDFQNNTIDFGLLGGASYSINELFSLEARYNLGLLNLDDIFNLKNRFLQLGVSYNL